MSLNVKKLFLLCFAVLIIFVLFSYCYFYYQINTPFKKDGREEIFEIQPGAAVRDIAQLLEDKGLIRSKFCFEAEVWLQRREAGFQAGEYTLSPSMNIKKIINLMTSPVKIKEREITLIEGWQRKEIAEYLARERITSIDDFLNITSDAARWKQSFSFLADLPQNKSLEGYLFPDTYRIYRDAEAEEIVEKILKNFDKKLTPELRQEITRQKKTIYEIITLASIVEKEVRSEKDMKLAAGVFYNRLEQGLPLQSDATITFITGKKDPRPTARDLEIDSPYNTYKFTGLPPGPISNPGISAIKAVIYPQDSDYMYFLTPKDGSTVFSKTLKEHNLNKIKYLGY